MAQELKVTKVPGVGHVLHREHFAWDESGEAGKPKRIDRVELVLVEGNPITGEWDFHPTRAAVTVYGPAWGGNKHPKAVNWSAHGSVSPDEAMQYALLIAYAAQVAEALS